MRKRRAVDTTTTTLVEQLPLFPCTGTASPIASTASLARHFSRFLKLQPQWQVGEPSDLTAMSEAFLEYLAGRLGPAVAQASRLQAGEYAQRRLWLVWLQSGAVSLEAVPGDVARQFRRHELRYYLHEVMGHYLKTLRRELAGPGDEHAIAQILSAHLETLYQHLDGLLAERPAGAPPGIHPPDAPSHVVTAEL